MGVPAVAIVFDLPSGVVLARNAARPERVVDPLVVNDHLARVRALADRGSLEAEGFEAVHRLTDPPEIELLTIHRLSRKRSIPPR